MSLGTILLIILVLLLIGALPNWGYSRAWGRGPAALASHSFKASLHQLKYTSAASQRDRPVFTARRLRPDASSGGRRNKDDHAAFFRRPRRSVRE